MAERPIPLPGTVNIPDVMTQQPSRYDTAIQAFNELSIDPPKHDPYMAACYTAAFSLSQQETPLHDLLEEVVTQREMTPKHLGNLFYRGVQLVELFYRENGTYPTNYITPEAWEQELTDIVTSKDGSVLKDVLLHKDTTSTIYQRYAGAKTLLTGLFPHTDLAVADFGCGGNYGLRGMALATPEPFGPITDLTPQKTVTRLVEKPLTIDKGLAIDREDPNDPAIRKWRLACSFYPQELGKLPGVVALEERLQQANNVRFYKGDLLALPVGSPGLPAHSYDAVILSTCCYQMNEAQQEQVFSAAASMIHDDGLVIVQDFAVKDRNNPYALDYNVNWHKTPYSYRNFVFGPRTEWKMKEVLQWNDGRCETVKPGDDFALLTPHTPSVFPEAA